MTHKTKIAILLTCHNRRQSTIECLKSVYNCDLSETIRKDIFLVDDGSSDGTSSAVSKKFPDVKVIVGNGELYWNRGMYLAWISAIKCDDYDHYIWLNDDTVLLSNSLKILLDKSLEIGSKKILVGATHSTADINTITYSGYFSKRKLIPNGSWQECEYFNGNIVLIPRFIYKTAGVLNEKFRHSLGDYEYGLRVSKLGYNHLLAPIPLGICDEHKNAPIWRNSNYSISKRLKHLYSPLGNNPNEYFIFDKMYNGLFLAIVHYLSIHLRSLIPALWKK